MNQLAVLMLLLSSSGLLAQEYFTRGQKYRLLGDQVNVREQPSETGRVIAVLPIGTEVTVQGEAEGEYTSNKLTAPWFKVAYRHQGKAGSGFVWGGLIAKGYRESKGLMFLYGVAPRADEGQGTVVRVVRAGKEIGSARAQPGAGFTGNPELALTGGRGFRGVENIFVVDFEANECAGLMSSLYFFWDGKALRHVHTTEEGADAPVYATEDRVFPDDKGGRPNQMHILREEGNSEEPASVKKTNFWLRWTGTKLERVK